MGSEVGKRERTTAVCFLRLHYQQVPRSMLRYAIERFPEERRQQYLKGTLAPADFGEEISLP
jgi:hypothetical protein